MANASDSLLQCPKPTGRGNDSYDVFLSYSRSDTGKKFTDHLYHSLVNAGTIPIRAFRDINSITIGEEFKEQILGAISRSKISIPIISKSYAARKWCLRELVHMMERRASSSHVVLPIFYEVEPSDVGKLQGDFGSAYDSCKNGYGKNDKGEEYIPLFEQALKDVSGLEVWPSEKIAGGFEGEFVQLIVNTVRNELRRDFQLNVTEDLVGIDDHVKIIKNWVDSPATHARMIGIYGMGGIGKTTLAKAIYNELSKVFVDHSKILDIREKVGRKDIPYVQNLLIKGILPNEREVSEVDDGINLIKSIFKCKKVLILLDDIDERIEGGKQLDALARNHDWFMAGSIIIVTTRDEDVLNQAKFKEIKKYRMKELDGVYPVRLFNRHAFRMNCSLRDFEEISCEITSTMGGLPLALEVVGSSLFGETNLDVWQDTLKRSRNQSNKYVHEKLKISYDRLGEGHKKIFLDIACFIIGEDIKYANYMWEDCMFYPILGIKELKLKCLIKIGDGGKFTMHDELRKLGKIIFCQEQPPDRCIRLWADKEAFELQLEKRHLEELEEISYYDRYDGAAWHTSFYHFETYTSEQFKNLPSSRFLQLSGAALSGDFNGLFSELRWLRWFCTKPDLSFSAMNLHLSDLVVLELSHNDFTDDWEGWSSIMAAKRLKVLDLAYSRHLKCTPDLSAFAELKILILNYCGQLEQVHPSIGKVKSLVSLDLSWCPSLQELPEQVGKLNKLEKLILHDAGITKMPLSIGSLRKLEELDASGCWALREIPISIGNLSSLKHLNLGGCRSLRGIPSSIGSLSSLQHLNLEGCKSLGEIPSSIGNLSSLQNLDLQDCWSLREIPSSIGDLRNMQHLDISRSAIEKLPSDIGRLKELRSLILKSCKSLKGEIPNEIGDLSSLKNLEVTSTPMSGMPESIQNLSLERLDLKGCSELRSLPKLPSILTKLTVCCQSPGLPQLSCLTHLKELNLYSCALLAEFPELPSGLLKLHVQDCGKLLLLKLEGFKYLEKFSLVCCAAIERLDLSQLNRLKELGVMKCSDLVEIMVHDNLESSEKTIYICDCKSLGRLILSDSWCLKQLTARSCNNLVEIQGLDKAESLEDLEISKCGSIKTLPDLSCCATLKKLNIDCCRNLRSVESLERFLSCRSICILECESLEKLPNLSKFENLETFIITSSLRLTEIPGIEESRSLTYIDIKGCESMKTLPDLSRCVKLKFLVVRDCKKLTQLQGLEKLPLDCLDISGCILLETEPELPGTRVFKAYDAPSIVCDASIELQ